MTVMGHIKTTRRGLPRRRDGDPPQVPLFVRMSPDLRLRLKVVAAEEGKSYAAIIAELLDMREDRIRRSRAAARHPLARGGAV